MNQLDHSLTIQRVGATRSAPSIRLSNFHGRAGDRKAASERLIIGEMAIYHPLRRAFVSLNNSWASSVRFGRFSSTCRLEETESLADSRPLMFAARILIAPCSHVVKPLPEALSLRFLEHKMGRVFRSLAFGYGKPQRMKVQTIEQQFSLTEKNGYRRDVERVD